MNEAETRAEHIDPALAAAGWGEIQPGREDLELGFPVPGPHAASD
jgi:hypothetical protein